MNLPISIQKLSTEIGVTSRTLRHWESEGLFNSERDIESGWRIYDEEAVLCIKITAALRKLDIPLKDIKYILNKRTFEDMEVIIRKQISSLEENQDGIKVRKNMLINFLDIISKMHKQKVDMNSLTTLNDSMKTIKQYSQSEEMEDKKMSKKESSNIDVRFITLPPMRMVYNIAVGVSPEDEAMNPVLEWLESSGLMGTARLFGGNVEPYPSKNNPEYGYGMCASIPEGIHIPSHLKEMRFQGGVYAMTTSSDDIYNSWQDLMKYLSENDEYVQDSSRLCLEEHIRTDSPADQGNQFIINLLEPVKRKNSVENTF